MMFRNTNLWIVMLHASDDEGAIKGKKKKVNKIMTRYSGDNKRSFFLRLAENRREEEQSVFENKK